MTREAKLNQSQIDALFLTLRTRFSQNVHRHPSVTWDSVLKVLSTQPKVLQSVYLMEDTGGEPDVILLPNDDGVAFFDCAKESPLGRRSLCYDHSALESRKEHQPRGSAVALAEAMGVTLLTEEEYRFLQTIEPFDLKTSSWIMTPDPIRKLGGSLFADRRYDHVFVYHNGAASYYAARGFRGLVRLSGY